jgi:hypothetical protein
MYCNHPCDHYVFPSGDCNSWFRNMKCLDLTCRQMPETATSCPGFWQEDTEIETVEVPVVKHMVFQFGQPKKLDFS